MSYSEKDGQVILEKVVSTQAVPKVTMQMLLDVGLNAFGLQQFAESFAGRINPEKADGGLPFSFSFRGLRFTVEQEPGEEIDTLHAWSPAVSPTHSFEDTVQPALNALSLESLKDMQVKIAERINELAVAVSPEPGAAKEK